MDNSTPPFIPYAKKLDSIINLYSPQTKVVFYMTWGYRYGDANNCPYYPPFCTYFSMSERLYQNYSLMAHDFFFPYCTRWSSMEEIHNHRFNISSSLWRQFTSIIRGNIPCIMRFLFNIFPR